VHFFRDPLSGLTHFIAFILAVIGLVFLLLRDAHSASGLHLISFTVFGGAMIFLYLFSTLYHWLPVSGSRLRFFRKMDHMMIFIFIAASYTPICLISLHGPWGWSILSAVWGLTLLGILFKLFWLNAPRKFYTAIYLLMGWIIVIGIWPLSKAIVTGGIYLLTLGGLFYTIGAVVYALKKPDPVPSVFGFHELFHLFVILGSSAHYLMMYRYV